MAAINSLVLQAPDSKNYTFKPTGFVAPNLVDYVNKTGVPDEDEGSPLPAIGQPRIRISTVRATVNRNAKVTIQIDAPVLAEMSPSTASGIEPAATRAYNPIAKVEFFLPRQSGEMSRERLLDLTRGVLADAVITDAVVDLEFPW